MTDATARSVLPATPIRWFLALVAANLVVRFALLATPGYFYDVEMYRSWSLAAARGGLSTVYDGTSVDYPPLFLYVLYGVGKVYLLFDPGATPGNLGIGWLLTALVKLPHLIFDLLIGGLLLRLVGRAGYWGPTARDVGLGRTAALLYLWNPAVLWNSGWWGQPDSIHSALAVGALAAAAASGFGGAGALLAMAVLMKPLAVPLVPLLAAYAALRRGWRGFTAVATGGCCAAAVLFLPFVMTGRTIPVLRRILGDLDAMPYASVNATNVWWLLGASRDANVAWIGPLSPQFLGWTAFLAVYAALLARSAAPLAAEPARMGDSGARLCLVAAAVTCSFFFLTTHMHENHMFMAVPLLLATAGRSRRLACTFAAATVAVLVNGMLHDLWLPGLLPSPLDALSPYADPHIHRAYTWLQILGSGCNAVLVAGVAVVTYRETWRIGSK